MSNANPLFPALGPTSFPYANTITLGGVTAPGKWSLVRAPKLYGWQVQQAYGLTGAAVFPKGDPLVVAVFKVEIWDGVIDWPAFLAFDRLYLKKPVVAVAGALSGYAIGIEHPELNRLGVKSVVPLEVNPFIPDEHGLFISEVHFLQYRKPKPALSKPLASIPDTSPPAPTAQDAAQRELQAATAAYVKLAGQL